VLNDPDAESTNKAMKLFHKASQIDPSAPESHVLVKILTRMYLPRNLGCRYNNMGMVFAQKGDNHAMKMKGLQFFKISIEKDPYYLPASLNLASLLNELGIPRSSAHKYIAFTRLNAVF
jgi:hypothetical protein